MGIIVVLIGLLLEIKEIMPEKYSALFFTNTRHSTNISYYYFLPWVLRKDNFANY